MSPSAPDATPLTEARDFEVVDRQGRRIGTLSQIYVHADTGRPRWVQVAGGLYGMATHLAPASLARVVDERVVLDAPAVVITHAPALDPGDGITADEESVLEAHYAGTRGWE